MICPINHIDATYQKSNEKFRKVFLISITSLFNSFNLTYYLHWKLLSLWNWCNFLQWILHQWQTNTLHQVKWGTLYYMLGLIMIMIMIIDSLSIINVYPKTSIIQFNLIFFFFTVLDLKKVRKVEKVET